LQAGQSRLLEVERRLYEQPSRLLEMQRRLQGEPSRLLGVQRWSHEGHKFFSNAFAPLPTPHVDFSSSDGENPDRPGLSL
jgi:hypothetical protein